MDPDFSIQREWPGLPQCTCQQRNGRPVLRAKEETTSLADQ
jgi:hypothetical protein